MTRNAGSPRRIIIMSSGLLASSLILGCATSKSEMHAAVRSATVTEDLHVQLERADAALREARLLDAEIYYRELTRSHPSVPDVWLRLGNIYVRQGQLDAADHTYRSGMKYAPQDGRLWFNLALVQLRQATDTLEVSSGVLPKDSPYRRKIAELHRALLEVSTSERVPSSGPGVGAP